MRKFFTSGSSRVSRLICLISISVISSFYSRSIAQISGNKTVCSSGCDYTTIAGAVSALNTSGVGSGGVNIYVNSGHTETLTSAIILTATGTAANPILISGGGGGTNPKITAHTGTGTLDGIFILSGSDYVTIDGIDLEENSSNTTNTTRMEWGYALLKKNASASSDGCRNNIIQNCNISLNKANTGTSGLVTGCVGIYMANHVFNSTTSYAYSDTVNTSSRNQFYTNSISNVYHGIYFSGYSSSINTYDQGNIFGRSGLGNTISNFGGSSSVCYANYISAQHKLIFEGNNINGGNATTTTLYGIYTINGTNASIRISDNTITLTPVAASSTTTVTGTSYGLINQIGSSGTNNTIEITDNRVINCSFANTTSGSFYGIYNAASGFNVKVERNRVMDNTFGSTSVTNTGTHYYFYYSATNSTTGSISSLSDNIVKGNVRLVSGTGAGGSNYGYYIFGGGLTFNITSDTTENNTYRSNTGTTADMYISSSGSGTYWVSKNILINNSRVTATTGTHYGLYFGGSTTSTDRVFNNTIGGFTLPSSGFTGNVYGIYFNGSTNQNYIYGNKVYDYAGGGGTLRGIAATYGHTYIYNNTVGNLTATYSNVTGQPSIRGIDISTGTSADVYFNTVYIGSTSSTGANFGTAGLYTSTTIQSSFRNNIFVNLATPGSSGKVVGHWRNGISTDKIDPNSQNNIYYSGSPSSSRLIYWDGALGCQTMTAYAKRLKIAEIASVTENVAFTSTTGTSSDFLHIDPSTPTNIESNGVNISGYSEDVDNAKRQGNTGYTGSGSAPDIGADEGEFTGKSSDEFPPALINVSAPVSCYDTSRTIYMSVLDQGGIPTSGSDVPRLYYKKGKSGSFQSVSGSLTSGNGNKGNWKFVINFSSFSSFAKGDTAYMFCIVQDKASTPNISSFPGGATASGVNSVSAYPRDTFYFINSGAAMGGTFTVGGTGADYPTIKTAVADIQAKGLCGPVTININPGVYREKIVIPNILSSAPDKWVTFQSSTGKANDVIIIDSTTVTTDIHVWRFDNSKYMSLRNVTLLAKGTYGWPLHIYGTGAKRLNITGCKMVINDSSSSSSNFIPLVVNNSTSSYSTGIKVDSITLDSNTFKYGYFGSTIYGSGTTIRNDNWTITNNTYYGQYMYGIYALYTSGLTVRNNQILKKLNSTTQGYGIYLTYSGLYLGSKASVITNNYINTGTTYAVYMANCDNSSTSRGLFANNEIIGPGSYGIYNSNSNFWDFYHNSINMYNPTSSYSHVTIYNVTSLNNEYKNNILAITSSLASTSALAFNSNVQLPTGSIDNNIYWNPLGTNFLTNLTSYTSTNFNTSLGGGVNSRSIKPVFASNFELEVEFSCLTTGPFISSVDRDITGLKRNTTVTTVGAYEASPLSNDVAIMSILSPSFPITPGSQTVSFQIQNNSNSTLTSVTARYQVNGGAPVTEVFSFAGIGLCETKVLTFTPKYTHSSGCLGLRIWTSEPNSLKDQNTLNDTSALVNFGIAINGTFTIGGTSPDFNTLNDAVSQLKCGGVNGPVTFNIRPGVYREKVLIPNINGASNTNWITFQSATGKSADVLIQDSTISGTFNGSQYAVRFDNAKYMTLRNLSVLMKGNFGWGVHLFGPGTKRIMIKGCDLRMNDSSITSTNYIPLVVNGSLTSFSGGAKIDSLEIDSNYFKYGYSGISIWGSSTTSRANEIYFRNNVMYGPTSLGGSYFSNMSGVRYLNNTIYSQRSTGQSSYGGYFTNVGQYLTSAATEVSGNRVFNPSTSGFYFTSSTNSSGAMGLVYNNMISAGGSYGMYFTSSDFWHIYHNSINLYFGSPTYGLYSTTTGNVIKNNILAITSPTASATGYALYSSTTLGSGIIDYNIYWNPRGTNLMYNGTAYTTSTYRSATAGGANSYNNNPPFKSNTDLSLLNPCSGSGAGLSTFVPKDIFGTNRNSTNPIIGAHEVSPITYNAAATAIVKPASTSISVGPSYDLEVVVQNNGSTTITSLDVSYSINGNIVSDNFTGLNIPACGTDTVVFTGSKSISFSAGYNEVRAFTGDINSNTDGQHGDDTSAAYGYCALLSGNFTINPAGSIGGTNFLSFKQAVTALYSCGISGPVTITASAGTYYEQGTFPGLIPGASATNTVTINGVNPNQCKIVFNATSTDPRHVVQFTGVKHLRFMNIGIENTGTVYGWGINLKPNGTQPCDSLTIKGCIISVNQSSTSSNFAGITISNSNTSPSTSGNNGNFLLIDSNTINGGYYGITCFGLTSTAGYSNRGQSNRITRNTFNNTYYYAVMTYYQDSLLLEGNKIENLGRGVNTAGYGFYVYYTNHSRISKNRICNQSAGYGLYNYYAVGSASRPSIVSNNMFNVGVPGSNSTAYGMMAYYGTYVSFIHNSINILGNSSSSAAFYGYCYSGATYNNNRVFNNNFVNNGVGYASYVVGSNNTDIQAAFSRLDNNNYFSRGNYTFNFNSSLIANLTTWRTSAYMDTLFDKNSKNLDPDYIASCDLHTFSLALDSTAIVANEVTDDFDGEARNTVKPDIGADEYTPPVNNLGPTAILKPQAPTVAGMTDVYVNVKNFGADAITSAKISYKIGKKGSVKSINWTGNLASLKSDTAKFTGSNQYLLTIAAKDTLYAFTENPNGKNDGYPLNDTLWLCTCGALTGDFTLGDSTSTKNFVSFKEASTLLANCGVSGPVNINVAKNTYNEQVIFTTIPGAEGNKTVTFRSADGDPNSVKLEYAAPINSALNFVVKLRGVKRLTLRDLTLSNSGVYLSNYGTVLSFDVNGTQTSDSNLIYNNIIKGVNGIVSTSNLYALISSTSQNHQFNRIARNLFSQGSYAVYWSGNPVIPVFSKGISIDSNVLSNMYYMGIYSNYLEDQNFSANRITMDGRYSTPYGIYSSSSAKGGTIGNNTISFSNVTGGYPLYMQYPSYYISNYPTYNFDDGSKKMNIYNNSISMLGTNSVYYGMYLAYPTNTNVHHNTVNIIGNSYGLYTNALTDSSFNIENNIFTTESNYPIYLSGAAAGHTKVNNNNYFNKTKNGPLGYLINTGYSTIASLQGALYTLPENNDSKSLNVNPEFVSNTDLRIKNSDLVGVGANVGVSMDNLGIARNTSTPTLGAFEFTGDLRVTAITEPQNICASVTPLAVKLRVKNVGYTPVKDYTLSYKVNGGSINSELVSSVLNPGDSILITHSVKSAFKNSGTYVVKAFTSYTYDVNVKDTFTGSVNVLNSPKPSYTLMDTCAGKTVSFTNTSTIANGTISSVQWSFGDGNSATGNSVTHKFTNSGISYLVKLVVTSDLGCVDSAARQVFILTPLQAGTIGKDQAVCFNTAPTLLTSVSSASGSKPPYNYQWQSSTDGINFTNISGANGLDYQPGTHTSSIYYRRAVNNPSGCGPNYSNVVKITANAKLSAGVIGSPQTICYNGNGSALTFSNRPTGAFGGYTYQWQQSTDSSIWSNISGKTDSTFIPSKITSVTYFRALVFSGACPSEGTNGVKIKLFSPILGGTIAAGQTICAGSIPSAFTQVSAPTGGPGTYTFQWQSSTDSINWNDISGANSAGYSSSAISSVTYFRRLAGNTGCPSGVSNALKVRTNPKPTIAFTASNHCFNDQMPLSNNSSITSGTLSYLWKFGDGTTSTSRVPNKTYGASGTYSVTLVSTSNNGCKDSASKSVIVATTPLPNFSFNLKCLGDSVIFTDQTVYPCGISPSMQFHWNFGDGKTSSTQNARHHYSSAGTYSVKFKLSLPGGYRDSITKTVVFNIRSTPAFTATNECYPSANSFSQTSSNYSSISWSFGDGSSSNSGSSSFTKSYASPGNYNVKLLTISAVGCRDSIVKTVSLFSKPTANFSTANSCLGVATTFSNSSSGANTYEWKFGDGSVSTNVNPTHNYASAGTYTVTLRVISVNGCVDSILKSVTIYPNPKAGFTTGNVCLGTQTSFTNTSTGASTFNWNLGNGTISTSTNPVYTYPGSGNYTVTLTATTSNGCSDKVSSTYTVYSSPTANFSASNVCFGKSISFVNSSSGAASSLWNFGDGTTSGLNSPSKTYSGVGNFDVKLKVTNSFGCVDSILKSVTIYTQPVANFSAGNECIGKSVTFNNSSTGNSTNTWTFGDGNSSASQSPVHQYANSGAYNVKLSISNAFGCKDSLTKSITVFPKPNVSFTATPNPICRGGLMNFTNTTTNGASYTWNFGNGNSSNSTNPTNIFNVAGNYNVKLVSVSTNGCKDSASRTVTVWPRPTASFNVNNGCSGDNLNFASNSVGAVSHAWTFGDGNSSSLANPAKGYATAGTYNVRLIVTSVNGCLDTTASNVIVYPRATVSFTNPGGFCVGQSATFTNTSSLSSGNMTYQWNFGDGGGSSVSNPTYTYQNSGNFKVTLTASTDKGCVNSSSANVLVYPKPTANFHASNVCQNATATFTNTSVGAISSSWDFGDAGTSTLTSPTHVYTNSGTYTVKLTVTNSNGCVDVLTKQVEVYSNPVANFTFVDRCVGQSTQFTNTSTGANDIYWQFGDGFSSNSANPVHNYGTPGIYNVTLFIESAFGCSNSVTKAVNVFALPKAAFSINQNGQCINTNAFVFTDNSVIASGSYTRAWTLGDGGTSSSANPSKTYASAGNYTVKLVITSISGCKDSVQNIAMVYPKPTADFNINNAFQCEKGHLFVFTDASTIASGSLNRNWNFGDGTTAGGINALRSYASAGTYQVNLYVSSDEGCSDNITKSVTVTPNPVASFTTNNDIQCLNGNSFVFTNTSSGASGMNSSWKLGDGSSITTTNASRTYSNAGTYRVSLNVSTTAGCRDSAYYTMKVLANPADINISGPITASNGSTQVYSVPFNAGSSYNWVAVNGTVLSNGSNMIQVKWNASGSSGSVSVTETGTNGCNGNPAISNVTLSPSASIANFHKNAFAAKVYPNPSKDQFVIEVGTGDMVTMNMYDPLGREVLGDLRFNNKISLDQVQLAAGIYQIRLTTDKGKTTVLRLEIAH